MNRRTGQAPAENGRVAAALRPPELSGCAVVDGGVLMVEDELIGGVLLARDLSGAPLRMEGIKLERKKKQRKPYADRDKLFPVQDFEDIASDRQEDVYLLGSHNGKGGERRPDREFLFHAEWDKKDAELKVIGERYDALEFVAPALRDIGCDIGLTRESVAEVLNLEGLALHDGRLYIGLRGPTTPDGAAVLLAAGADAVFSGGDLSFEAITLDLNGGGIRALDWDPRQDRLLIISGPATDGDKAAPALWRCGPNGQDLERLLEFDPAIARKNPEGVCRLDDGRLLIALDGEDHDTASEVIFLQD